MGCRKNTCWKIREKFGLQNTSLVVPGALAHRLQRRNDIKAARGPKMADGVSKGVYSWVFGRSHQLLINKFFGSEHSFYEMFFSYEGFPKRSLFSTS